MTPDLSYYWEGARDSARISGMDKHIYCKGIHIASLPYSENFKFLFICPFFSTQKLVTNYIFFCAVVHPEEGTRMSTPAFFRS